MSEEKKEHMDTWVNRTLCSVFEDMRKCVETLNFSGLSGLIEEAQTYGNRMEGALEDGRDFKKGQERLSQLKKDHNKLVDEYNELLEKVNDEKRKDNSEPTGKGEDDSESNSED